MNSDITLVKRIIYDVQKVIFKPSHVEVSNYDNSKFNLTITDELVEGGPIKIQKQKVADVKTWSFTDGIVIITLK